ncbi:polyhydroxyalkanoate synthesis repressor PhaR [Aestuariispira insulae]|uniref:Polyhydroxyalkanoate synthesis repressor PhaR n=1 Tax=Aestuariispira insulae TaxID=1461337 RepID=A0A3D9HXF2_9PROT|nr:polyhydroxyalkanoate synthesis repressor PhaR [Aestuariispira insulae]RED54051.1 polyhydroxyalkanoate synthesis repressor PhaR [Aestuariispira insulae]
MSDNSTGKVGPITIKKYANRRLYNTATSSYVTLDHLCQMVKDGVEFEVFDAKTGEDITRSVLTQIIVEEESKGDQNLLPISFLRQLISFYGDNVQQMLLPQYLDMSMQSFTQNKDQIQDYMNQTFGNVFPFGNLEEMGKQNMAMFEQAMQMFSPFNGAGFGAKPAAPEQRDGAEEAPAGNALDELQKQMQMMQKKLEDMEKGK